MRLSNLDTNVDKNSEIELQARAANLHLNADSTTAPIQPGTIVAYIGSTAPTGWLLCDGSEIDSQYDILISLVGTHTPDMRGKMAYCVSDISQLKETGGTFNHTHTIPAHSHTCDPHTHTIVGHTHHTLAHCYHYFYHSHKCGSHRHYIEHYHTIPGHSHLNTTITFSAANTHYHDVPYADNYTSTHQGNTFYGWATGTKTVSGNGYGSKSSPITISSTAIHDGGVSDDNFTMIGTDTSDGAGNTTISAELTTEASTTTSNPYLYSSSGQITEDASLIGIVATDTSDSITVANNISSASSSGNAAAYIINFIIKY